MQRNRGASGTANAGFRRQRQTRPTSRFDADEGSDTYNRADLSKLKVSSLKKYVKVHDIPGVSPLASKEDLLMAVNRHFMGEIVDEKKVIDGLIQTLKRGQLGHGR